MKAKIYICIAALACMWCAEAARPDKLDCPLRRTQSFSDLRHSSLAIEVDDEKYEARGLFETKFDIDESDFVQRLNGSYRMYSKARTDNNQLCLKIIECIYENDEFVHGTMIEHRSDGSQKYKGECNSSFEADGIGTYFPQKKPGEKQAYIFGEFKKPNIVARQVGYLN